jgi:shikimate dehydrogenase
MKITSSTKLCALIGSPVKHSLSPILHNAAYKKLELDFVYLAFAVEDLPSTLYSMKALGIKGFSVTVPHKIEVIRYLDEIDPVAEKIGAVNTILNHNGKLKGYNTDAIGAVKALESESGKITGKKIAILGAGGAARAIAFGLKQASCAQLVILNRSIDRARGLALELGAETQFGTLDEFDKIQDAKILINATTIGMESDLTPLAKEKIPAGIIVKDIVYNPLLTKFLRDAQEKSCQIITGEKMLLHQAIKQFELFTDLKEGSAESLIAFEAMRASLGL